MPQDPPKFVPMSEERLAQIALIIARDIVRTEETDKTFSSPLEHAKRLGISLVEYIHFGETLFWERDEEIKKRLKAALSIDEREHPLHDGTQCPRCKVGILRYETRNGKAVTDGLIVCTHCHEEFAPG